MPSIKLNVEPQQRNRTAIISLAIALIVITAAVVYWLRIPPQMGGSEEVFDTVDALFTAVTSRDEKRLADCERRLKSYSESGKLPASAWNHLDGIIQKARGGGWQSAAESLYNFMLAQRREGYEGHEKKTPPTKKLKK